MISSAFNAVLSPSDSSSVKRQLIQIIQMDTVNHEDTMWLLSNDVFNDHTYLHYIFEIHHVYTCTSYLSMYTELQIYFSWIAPGQDNVAWLSSTCYLLSAYVSVSSTIEAPARSVYTEHSLHGSHVTYMLRRGIQNAAREENG